MIVRIYQLFADSDNGHALTKVAGSALQSETDFSIYNFGEIKQSVEYKDGLFKLDSLSLITDGIPEWYFKAFDSGAESGAYKPFVVEVRDGHAQDQWAASDVVFHGIVDPDSVQYDLETWKTNFTVWSWEYILTNSEDVPARSVYETYATQPVRMDDISANGSFRVYLYGDVSEGDVLVFDSAIGEQRGVARSVFDEGGGVKSARVTLPQMKTVVPEVPCKFVVREKYWGPSRNNNKKWWLDYFAVSTNLFTADTTEAEAGYLTVYKGTNPIWSGPMDSVQEVEENDGSKWAYIDPKGSGTHWIDDEYDGNFDPAALDVYTLKIERRVPVDVHQKITVLGRDIYGYGNAVSWFLDYAVLDTRGATPTGILFGLCSLRSTPKLSLFASVVNEFSVPDGGYAGRIDREMDFPTKLIDSLRAIQRTSRNYVRFIPTKDDSLDLPRLRVEVRGVEDAAQEAAIDASALVVKSWSEKTVDAPVRAVVVEAPDVEKPDDYGDVVGWYPDNPSATDKVGVPQGDDVVKLKTLLRPAYSGDAYAGGKAHVINDAALRTSAERWYAFFRTLGAKADVVLYGIHTGMVGKKYTFDVPYTNAQDVTEPRTGVVVASSINQTNQTTTLTLRRGAYEAPSGEYVKLVPNYTPVVQTAAAPVSVQLDGSRSIAPDDTAFAWNVVAGPNAPQTANGKNATISLDAGIHEINFTAVSPGGADHTEKLYVEVVVRDVRKLTAQPSVEHSAIEDGAAGSLTVTVLKDGALPEVVFRKASGRNLRADDDETFAVSTDDGAQWTFVETVMLHESHNSYIEAEVRHQNGIVEVIGPVAFDADTVPNPSWSHKFDWNGTAFTVYVTLDGDSDTASGEVVVDDGSTQNTTVVNGRNVYFSAGSYAPDTSLTITATAYNGADATGTPQAAPAVWNTSTPAAVGGLDQGTTIEFAGNGIDVSPSGPLSLNTNPTVNLSLDTSFTPNFAQIELGSAATASNHGVRADRTITLTGSNGVEIDTGSSVAKDLTGDVTFALRTSQDLRTSASPQFSALGVGGTSSGFSLNVHGDAAVSGYLGSTTYVSGFGGSGWRVDASGNLEVDNLTVRNALTTSDFIKSQISIERGSALFSGGARVAQVIGPNITSSDGQYAMDGDDFELVFEQDHPFQTGDLLQARRYDASNMYLSVVWVVHVHDTDPKRCVVDTYSVHSQQTAIPQVGFDYARFGSTADADRQGTVYISTVDGGSPFVDVLGDVDHPEDWFGDASGTYSGAKTMARFGKLDGLTTRSGPLSGYGLMADAGSIAGWHFDSRKLASPGLGVIIGDHLSLNNAPRRILIGNWGDGTAPHVKVLGPSTGDFVQMYYNSDSQWGVWGETGGSKVFELGSTNQIAGWEFDRTNLTKTVDGVELTMGTLHKDDAVGFRASDVSSSREAGLRSYFGHPQLWAYDPAGFEARMGGSPWSSFGFVLKTGSTEVFNVDSAGATIAGWQFDENRITKNLYGMELAMGRTHDYSHNYWGWRISRPDQEVGMRVTQGNSSMQLYAYTSAAGPDSTAYAVMGQPWYTPSGWPTTNGTPDVGFLLHAAGDDVLTVHSGGAFITGDISVSGGAIKAGWDLTHEEWINRFDQDGISIFNPNNWANDSDVTNRTTISWWQPSSESGADSMHIYGAPKEHAVYFQTRTGTSAKSFFYVGQSGLVVKRPNRDDEHIMTVLPGLLAHFEAPVLQFMRTDYLPAPNNSGSAQLRVYYKNGTKRIYVDFGDGTRYEVSMSRGAVG